MENLHTEIRDIKREYVQCKQAEENAVSKISRLEKQVASQEQELLNNKKFIVEADKARVQMKTW